MPSQTAKGYPYPLGTDRVMDGDDSIHSLADAVDSKAGVFASGTVTIAMANTAANGVSVTYPAGRFTAAPQVTAATYNGVYFTSISSPTATSCFIFASHRAGTATNINVTADWIARQG